MHLLSLEVGVKVTLQLCRSLSWCSRGWGGSGNLGVGWPWECCSWLSLAFSVGETWLVRNRNYTLPCSYSLNV